MKHRPFVSFVAFLGAVTVLAAKIFGQAMNVQINGLDLFSKHSIEV